jgi:polyphosphate glucokinase
MEKVLGIDIGGSGVKGAPVNVASGEMLAERFRLPTPTPSTPKAVARTVLEIKEHFGWQGPIGCGYPGVVRHGVTWTASNMDKKWIGSAAKDVFTEIIADESSPVEIINDADAAGLAEMHFGAGRGRNGVVMIITIGTGIGTALFTNGHLVPNLELGHMEVNGYEAEPRISDAVRQREDLSWKKWGQRFNEYLQAVHKYFWPDLIILGGGGSKKVDKFMPYIDVPIEIIPAQMLNDAGIIGAALAFDQDIC